MTNGYFSIDKFKIAIESRYNDDKGTTENILNMPPNELKSREVIFMDIAEKDPKEERPAEEVLISLLRIRKQDVTAYHSNKRNIGPLAPKWYETMGMIYIYECFISQILLCVVIRRLPLNILFK